jgi:hypothetical protein
MNLYSDSLDALGLELLSGLDTFVGGGNLHISSVRHIDISLQLTLIKTRSLSTPRSL